MKVCAFLEADTLVRSIGVRDGCLAFVDESRRFCPTGRLFLLRVAAKEDKASR